MTEYKCGDCFYAELCEKSEMLIGFSKDNYAYCSMFLNSADVALVVRCRDCKHYLIVDETLCMRRYMCTVNHFSYLGNDGDNHFCSYGERKDG